MTQPGDVAVATISVLLTKLLLTASCQRQPASPSLCGSGSIPNNRGNVCRIPYATGFRLLLKSAHARCVLHTAQNSRPASHPGFRRLVPHLVSANKEMCWTICGIGGIMINNGSGCKFNHGTMMIHGTSMGLWHPALDINKTTYGISEIDGMPIIGIDGDLAMLVAVMMGGRRGHCGIVHRRRTSTRASLQMGRKSSLENPTRLSSHTERVVEHH